MRLASFVFAVTLVGFANPAFGTVEQFTEGCLTSSNLERPICECCGRKAKARLSPLAFEFLVATLQENKAKVEELRPKLSMDDAMQAGMFMVNTPSECAEELHGQ